VVNKSNLTWVAKIKVWVWGEKDEKKKKRKLGLGPINLDTQSPMAQLLRTLAQGPKFKPNPNWAPKIFKAHFEYAPATSKLQINSWACHLYLPGGVQFLSTWLSRPPAPGDSVYFHRHISNISQTHLFI
jgi:hypothetical protein